MQARCSLDILVPASYIASYLCLLLLYRLLRSLLFSLVHFGAGCLRYEAEDFQGGHIDHFCDAALHDEEVRVVDIELHRVEQVLHLYRYRRYVS